MAELGGPAVESLVELLDERRHLLEIALWIFDSETIADRIVQEAYRRWYALREDERGAIAVPRAWLTRATGAICLELLGSIDTLEPPLATARVAQLEPDLGHSRLQLRRSSQALLRRHARVVHRFAAACAKDDLPTLERILAIDAVVVSDGGGKVRTPAVPVVGGRECARYISGLLSGHALAFEPVNGRLGLALRRAGQAEAVVSLSIIGSEVTAVWVVLNPDKLHTWHRNH